MFGWDDNTGIINIYLNFKSQLITNNIKENSFNAI